MPLPPLAKRVALGLMHATQVSTPFHRPGWIYEEKVDGYRMAAVKTGEGVRLINRSGIYHTKRFPSWSRRSLRLGGADYPAFAEAVE